MDANLCQVKFNVQILKYSIEKIMNKQFDDNFDYNLYHLKNPGNKHGPGSRTNVLPLVSDALWN